MNIEQIEKHTPIQSVILHLLPGMLITCFYFLVRKPVQNLGYPPLFSLVLAIIFILIPFELGYLLYQSKKKTGRFNLSAIIAYRTAIPWWQYILWSFVAFGVIGALMYLLKPVELFLQDSVFYWVPSLDSGLDGYYSKPALLVTYVTLVIFCVIAGPLTEELYFRGYLLPRIKGRFAILIGSFLFALYHFFSPWLIVSRTIGFLPLIYSVKKKNIYVGMIIHILCNSVDAITGFIFIAGMQ